MVFPKESWLSDMAKPPPEKLAAALRANLRRRKSGAPGAAQAPESPSKTAQKAPAKAAPKSPPQKPG